MIALGGHPKTHILGERFYGQTPILCGPSSAKVAVIVASANLVALTAPQTAYEMSAEFRATNHHCPMQEPRSLDSAFHETGLRSNVIASRSWAR